MASVKLTKNELKVQKDALKMYRRYLPTLTLKKQQLQTEIFSIRARAAAVRQARAELERGFDDWYFIRMEADISDLRLQPEEVQDARWADLAEIERMLDSGEMVPYYRDLVRLWFVMKDHRGSTTHE